jgi:osmotically-inducible protein OsmY
MTDVATMTDSDIRMDVEAELEWEPSVDEGEIGVAVRDGIVTLTGRVPSFWQKWKAERVAERVNGVRGIANEIDVELEHERSDTDIARAAADALEWDTRLPTGAVKVKVENGWVTLSGEVSHDYQRRAAERAVRHLDGVRGVTNLISVKPQVTPSDIKEKIQRSFERLAVLDASNITVETSGDEVVLRGTVRSWNERHEAEKAAWAAPGVTAVRNYITVRDEW